MDRLKLQERNPNRFLFSLAAQARLSLVLAVAGGLLVGILVTFQASLLAGVITRVFFQGEGLQQNAGQIRLLVGVIFLRAAASYSSDVAARDAARKIKSNLRMDLLYRLKDPLRLKTESTGELAIVLNDGIEALDAYFSQYLPQAALAGLIPLVILLAIFPLDGLSAWILLLTGPLIPVFMILIGKAAEIQTRRQWGALTRLGSHFLDTIQGLATLKALNKSLEQGKILQASGERYRLASMQVLRVTFLSALALEWLATISTALLAVQIGLRLLGGGLQLEQALIVLFLAPEFYQPLRTLGLRFHAAQTGVSAARRILELLDQYPSRGSQVSSKSNPGHLGKGPLPAIRFEQVSCRYPGSESTALQDASIILEPGTHTVLVGLSGAGKTTIIYLLLGFLPPDSGRIWIGDTPLDQVDLEEWRSRCAWVPEKPHLFHDTIAANIRLGCPGANAAEVQEASALAGLADWIKTLPDGYETIIGEKGARISAGQAQRVALARAFIKDAPLLLLDEPVSSLDPELAASLASIVGTLASGRTVLTIAHRLSTIRNANMIYCLEGSRIVEAGTPSELARRDGIYARLLVSSGQEQVS